MSTEQRGQDAEGPGGIPKAGWGDILQRVWSEVGADHVSVVSAGVAFFGLLAIFPAVGAIISIAGLVLNPSDVAAQLDAVVALLPQNAASIIQDQIAQVTGGDAGATGFAAVIGFVLALYGASKGTMTLMEGMNIAYDERETRGFVALYATGFALTLFLILGLLIAVAVILVIPLAVSFLPLPRGVETLVAWIKWPILAVLTVLGLAVIYRFGPSRTKAKWRWVSPGALVATVLWLIGTVAFSVYAQNFGSYNETYGTLGGVIILLTWLWLSAFIVLAGAELNSEMEHQTRRDSTVGTPQPEGKRGARKADTTPEGLSGPSQEAGPEARDDGRAAPETRRSRPGSPLARPRKRDVAVLGLFAVWQSMRMRDGGR